MLNQMNKFGFSNYEFYEDYDANELEDYFVNQHYVSGVDNVEAWNSKVILWGPSALLYHSKQCNPAEISLTIKFGKVLKC